MSREEHPFDRLKARHAERVRGLADRRFEERQVSFVVQKCGLGHLAREVRAADPTGDGNLTFRGFGDVFPTFPLLLAASTLGGAKLHLDPRTFLPAMFKAFEAVPFVAAYEEVFERLRPAANGRAVGLTFPRNGLRHGFVIFDDLDLVAYHGLSLMYQGSDRKHRHRLFVQPFQETILAVWNKGHGWRPD